MIMKLATTDNRVLMAILVIASVGGTFAVVQGLDLTNLNSQSPLGPVGAMLTGNVKVIQYDEDGNIIAYRQTDNHIVKEGMEVIMAQVFRDINTTTNYPNPTVGLPHPIAGCVRQTTTISNTTAQGAHKYPGACTDAIGNLCSAQMNVTAVASFLGTASCNVNSIDEAGIYDNSTSTTVGMDAGGAGNGGGYMFARNNFGSVNLGMLDTLQLQWEFTFTDL